MTMFNQMMSLNTAGQALNEEIKNLITMFRTEGERAIPGLVSKLDSPYPDIRSITAILLGELGERASEISPDIMKLLGDSNEYVQMAAAITLFRIGKSVLPDLKDSMHRMEMPAKFWAAWTVIMLEPSYEEAIPVLKTAWQTSNSKYIQVAATEALTKALGDFFSKPI
jgi:HEAT repeat protein